jgi:hypothetical protein
VGGANLCLPLGTGAVAKEIADGLVSLGNPGQGFNPCLVSVNGTVLDPGETGGDGFWLARWLRARDIEAYVIHAASVAVSREHRRPEIDRLDTEQLKRAFVGWLRGERHHCKMAAIPTLRNPPVRCYHDMRSQAFYSTINSFPTIIWPLKLFAAAGRQVSS